MCVYVCVWVCVCFMNYSCSMKILHYAVDLGIKG